MDIYLGSELTWLVFGETLKISGTEPAFLSKQRIPNLGFVWETKAVQSSTATRTALSWSNFPGCLRTRWFILPAGETGGERTCVSSGCGCRVAASDTFGAAGREGQVSGGLALHPIRLCCCGPWNWKGLLSSGRKAIPWKLLLQFYQG